MDQFLINLIVSASFGALIGLERQWETQLSHPEQQAPAGLRTFTIVAVLGAICAQMSKTEQPHVFIAGLIALCAWFGILLYKYQADKGGAGLTTAATGMLTYLIGGMVVAGEAKTALVLTVSALLILACKPKLRSMTKHFTAEDVRIALQFLAVTGAILPVVPNQNFGPYNSLNLRSIWLMVVIVSGIGFIGYAATRKLGQTKGIALTGLVGGLASSTATTLGMSRMSKVRPEISNDCALALLIACTIMIWRVAILILAISPSLVIACLPNFAIMSIPGGVFIISHLVKKQQEPAPTAAAYQNPLNLKVALQFGLLYAIVVVIVKVAAETFGKVGLLVASGIAGLTDLDAISLSLANLLSANQISIALATNGILVALVANTILKAIFAGTLGSRELRNKVLITLGTTAALGIIILVLSILQIKIFNF